MKLITALVFVLCNSNATAATGFKLKIDLAMHGQQLTSPNQIIKEGEHLKYQQPSGTDTIFVDVVSTENLSSPQKAILMTFVIGKILPNGEKKIISAPRMVALEDEESEITVGAAGDKDQLTLKVVATRKDI